MFRTPTDDESRNLVNRKVEESAGPLVEQAVPSVPTTTDGAGQDGYISSNMNQPKQGQHHSQNTNQNQGSQFLPTHCYDPIANQISGDLSNNIQPLLSIHWAKYTEPVKMMQPPKEDSFHHSVLGCRDARYSS